MRDLVALQHRSYGELHTALVAGVPVDEHLVQMHRGTRVITDAADAAFLTTRLTLRLFDLDAGQRRRVKYVDIFLDFSSSV